MRFDQVRLGIRWKLLIGVVLPLLVLLGSLLFASFRERRADALEQRKLILSREAQLLAARYDAELRSIEQITRFNATLVAAFADALRPADEAGETKRLLQQTLAQHPLMNRACLTLEQTEGGSSVCAGQGGDAVDSGVLAAARAASDRVVWLEPRFAADATWPASSPDAGVLLATAVVVQGRVVGVASGELSLGRLHARITTDRRPESWISVVDRLGRFVAWSDTTMLSPMTYREFADRMSRPEVRELGDRMVSGESGTAIMPDPENPTSNVILAYAPIPTTGWSLVTALDENEVMTPVYRSLRDRAISAAGVLAVVTGAILGIGAWLTRPLKRLVEGVQALEEAENFDAAPVRVRTDDEIGDLSKSFNRMVRQLKRRVDELTHATRAKEAALSELRVARDIQASLLPRLDPATIHTPHYDLFAINAPALSVAGDFYDFFTLPDGRLALVIADVSGKGVPASIFMAVARTVIRDLAMRGEPPGRVLTEANARLISDNQAGMFVTVFVGYLDPTTGAISFANGGHQRPYVVGKKGVRSFGTTTGSVVGVLAGHHWTAGEERLGEAETIVLYTDGVPDARHAGGEFFGEDRFARTLSTLEGRRPEDLCAAVVETLDDWQGDTRADDVTLLALRWNGPVRLA